jgi:hypothetical protein
MENKSTINIYDPMAVRQAGLDALKERLGLEGMVNFLQQFGGDGDRIRDYTAERHEWLDKVSWEELVAEVQALDALRRGEAGQSAE